LPIILAGCTTEHQDFPRLNNLERREADAPLRLLDGSITEFIPGNDYGEIFPFLGQFNMGEWGLTFERYGFFDIYGRVICDPIFDTVTMITHGEHHAFVVSSNWTPEWAWQTPSVDGFRAVIPADGSFFRKFDDVYLGDWGFEFDYEFIPVKRDGKWGVIDFFGNLVLDFAFPNAPLFSDGLAAVFRWAEYEHLFEYFMSGVPFYYIDIHGNIVLGPFESPPMVQYVEPSALHLEGVRFQNGLAINFYDGHYGFIDTSGRLVIERNYLFFRSFQLRWNDVGLIPVALADTLEYIVSEWGYLDPFVTFALMDRNGNYIVRMPQAFAHGAVMEHDGYYTVACNDYWRLTHMFDYAGNEVPVYGDWIVGNRYFISRTWDDDTSTERLTGNGVDFTFTNLFTHWLFGDWFAVNDWNPDTGGSTHLWNAQTGEERHDFNTGAHITYRSPGRNVMLTSWEQDRRFGVYDDEGNIVIPFVFCWLHPIGENYFARAGRYGGLTGPVGEWIFRTRLSSNFD